MRKNLVLVFYLVFSCRGSIISKSDLGNHLANCLVLDRLANLKRSGSGDIDASTIAVLLEDAQFAVKAFARVTYTFLQDENAKEADLTAFYNRMFEEIKMNELCSRGKVECVNAGNRFAQIFSAVPREYTWHRINRAQLSSNLLDRDSIKAVIVINVYDDMIRLSQILTKPPRSFSWAKEVAGPLIETAYSIMQNHFLDESLKSFFIGEFLRLFRNPDYYSHIHSTRNNYRSYGDVVEFAHLVEDILPLRYHRRELLEKMRAKMEDPFK